MPNADFQRYLFLFTQDFQRQNSYEFIPCESGCFSFQLHADCRHLVGIGLFENDGSWKLQANDDFLSRIPKDERDKLLDFADQHRNLHGDSLIRHVCQKHPYYAIKSEAVKDMLANEELEAIDRSRPVNNGYVLFTIGYEGRSFENYLNRLIKNGVKILCGMRRNPISRKYGFSRSTLSETLRKLDIEYTHFPELGIVSEKRRSL